VEDLGVNKSITCVLLSLVSALCVCVLGANAQEVAPVAPDPVPPLTLPLGGRTPTPMDAPPPFGGSGGSAGYPYPEYVVPTACLAVEVITAESVCQVIDATKFVRTLEEALTNKDKFRGALSLMLKSYGPTIVGYAFPGQPRLRANIEIVEAIRDSEISMFQAMYRKIRSELAEDDRSDMARRIVATTSSGKYAAIVREAVKEANKSSDKIVSNLRSVPITGRVRFICDLACRQAIHVYQAAVGFD